MAGSVDGAYLPMERLMCNYCGCLEFPLIRRLTGEHELIEDTAGRLGRMVRQERLAEAAQLLHMLVGLLERHTDTEERGLFAELRAEGTLADEVDHLCLQHGDIHGTLSAAGRSGPDWPAVLDALGRLRRHIDDEEYDLFPAAVVTLPIVAWDRITPAEQTPTAA